MKYTDPLFLAAPLLLLLTTSSPLRLRAETPSPGKARSSNAQFGKLPLSFEANEGQADPRVRFTSRGRGYALSLTETAAVLSLTKPANTAKSPGTTRAGGTPADVIRMELVAPAQAPQVAGTGPLAGKANYFIGNDAKNWHANVPTFAQVKYTGVYPGVDLVYYGNQRQLEYDFVVAPRADASRVKLHFAGAEKLKLNDAGDLTVTARNGSIAFQKPVVYQVEHGRRQVVASQYRLLANKTIGFALAPYDHGRKLVIDPTLAYSTYLGGSSGNDEVNAVAVDSHGHAYITGNVGSAGFPVTAGVFQGSGSGIGPNVFVAEMNEAGDGLVYSTYLGGNFEEHGNAIAIDAQGNAYVVGSTLSLNFPTTPGSFQPKYTTNFSSAFITKLNPAGSKLVYSSYLSGSTGASPFIPLTDAADAITVDAAGDAYITGGTASIDFPVTSGAFQKTLKTAALAAADPTAGLFATNAFVSRVNPSGSALLYSSYLGGSGNGSRVSAAYGQTGDVGKGIALDPAGNVYVAGITASRDFPVTAGAMQQKNRAFTNDGSNAFVTKIDMSRPELGYSTYLGGTGFFIENEGVVPGDMASAIAVDADGRAYVAGSASSSDFPVTAHAFQKTNHAVGNFTSNAFIAELNPEGTALAFSTYLGGSGLQQAAGSPLGDAANGIAIDADGSVYVAGTAYSPNLPVTADAFQPVNRAADSGFENAFVAKFKNAGSALQYSTYLGGSGQPGGDFLPAGGDSGLAMALSASGDVYVVGSATSLDYPVTRDAFQKVNNDVTTTGFVAKLSIGGIKAEGTKIVLSSNGNPQHAGARVTFRARVTSASGSAVPTGSLAVTVDGQFFEKLPLDATGHATYTSGPLPAARYNIAVAYSGDKEDAPSSAMLVQVIDPAK